MFEMKYVALASEHLPSLFKWWPWGPKSPAPESPRLEAQKIFKNLFFSGPIAQMLEIRYVELPSGPLPRLFKSRSQGPKWPNTRGVLGSNISST